MVEISACPFDVVRGILSGVETVHGGCPAGEASVGPGVGVVRVAGDGIVERFDGLVEGRDGIGAGAHFIHGASPQGDARVVVGVGIGRVEVDGAPECRDGSI